MSLNESEGAELMSSKESEGAELCLQRNRKELN